MPKTSMKNRFLLIMLLPFTWLRAQEPPNYLVVEVRWQPADSGEIQNVEGELWLENRRMEILRIDEDGQETAGRVHSRQLTPRNPGEITIRRDGNHNDAPRFLLDIHGRREHIAFSETDLPVMPRQASSAEQLRQSIEDNPMSGELGDLFGDDDLIEELFEDEDAFDESQREGLRLELAVPGALREIPFSELREIRFLRGGEGYRFETYGGRYVQYSRNGRGDEGRVQLRAATYFGGQGRERFDAGGFMRDGSIALVASVSTLDFLENIPIRNIGRDQPLEDIPSYYRRTPVLVRYSPDLSRLREVVRLPWGAGEARQVLFGQDDAIYMTVSPGPGTESFFQSLSQKQVTGNPLGGHPHSYLLKISPEKREIEWAIKFEHLLVSMSFYPGERMLVRSGDFSRFIDLSTGQLADGPLINRVGSGRLYDQFIHPETGAFFLGGESHSGTGLEPWRNPWLQKYSPDGEIEWTAYDWTGPVVGVSFFRLVSDSSVRGIRMGEDGNLLLRGWSDGGNSVFTRQPYDLRQSVPMGGWCASIWGANVLSVSYLIRMNPDTQEVYGVTRYNSYLPTSNKPNSISMDEFTTSASGDVLVTGRSAFGFVETWDAWVTPWIKEYREDEFATAKGGSFLTVFRPDMRGARLATILPGVKNQKFATRGDLVLLFGEASPSSSFYGREYETLLKNPLQEFGGGPHDAYVMLIDTRGEPREIELPAWTWGDRAGTR